MKKLFFTLLSMLTLTTATAQTELTYSEAKTLYKDKAKTSVSVHDPSVVYDSKSKRYYIFGSHRGCAYSTNMQDWTSASFAWQNGTNTNVTNAEAFTTQRVKTIKKGGVEVALPQFNAMEWSARTDEKYDINGNMWAPDVVWNPVMKKWCYYLSINGDAWHSSIILLTSDNITGPYQYEGPVVVCGFDASEHSYKDTDLELVLGSLSSLPARYNVGNKWGDRWPHTIDPCVFYDEEGKLWMAYGSWSGGIWMLQLDAETGLRNYDVTYPSVGGSTNGVTSDPYFGKKISGGYYVSGEGSYVEHIGKYYYLFVSNGFYSPDGGYEMRVFRSEKPDGPYKDTKGKSAIFNSYVMNYGYNGDTRGEKLMGAYNHWGFMTVGECAQGHNSIIAANDGRTYLIYHTKFNNNTVWHSVRTHQVFVNSDGWLVAAPFEYNGEQITDADIAAKQPFTVDEIVGTYKLLVHKYGMDYKNYEEVTPIDIQLNADGTISGAKTGKWSITEGTGYISLTIAGIKYNGVVFEEEMDGKTIHTVSITACAPTTGVNMWAYKWTPKYDLAWQLNNQKEPVVDQQEVVGDLDLAGFDLKAGNVKTTWTSSNPDVISEIGKYNPAGLAEDTNVDLSVRLETPGYYWAKDYTVKAFSYQHSTPSADWQSGMMAYYGFDDDALTNAKDNSQKATLGANGGNKKPTLLDDEPLRNGKVVKLQFGANGKESYVSMPNPLLGQSLGEGATISFWVNRATENDWDALLGITDGTARMYMTGRTYVGYNNGKAGNESCWLDINHPTAENIPNNITVGKWHLVTLVFNRTAEVALYIDGNKMDFTKWNGSLNGKAISTATGFDYGLMVDLMSSASEICLGKGSYWGSAEASFDDVIIYNRPLSATEVLALSRMENRVFDFNTWATGIEEITPDSPASPALNTNTIYDLQGRRINGKPIKGLYIIGGKKVAL